jgi:anti-sigma factor RsiW
MGETMTKKRLDTLLAKELDGDLTQLEREELERLSRIDPDSRRDRATWKRFDDALKESIDAMPRLERPRLARRVLAGRDRARSIARPLWLTLPRVVLVGSSMLILALTLWRPTESKSARAPRSGVVVTAIAGDERDISVPPSSKDASSIGPVEVRIGEIASGDDRDTTPVTIRF